jgi:SHS family sialic acid transporter-like MFS transporter
VGETSANRGRWLALIAALLGWMFDGFEMGLFPVVARPALVEMLDAGQLPAKKQDELVGPWYAQITAGFLVGAATGGVLFGWLGDRLGRVRAMSLSILTYAAFSGVGAFAYEPWHLIVTRFIASLGMGGEWSLGVALVMEVWGGRSRGLLAGLIGATGNLGYLIVALLSMSIVQVSGTLTSWLSHTPLPNVVIAKLSANSAWRMLMLMGVLPAILTLFIRLFVPESGDWKREQARGKTTSWASYDLSGVLLGVLACAGIMFVWAAETDFVVRLTATAAGLAVVLAGYVYPVERFMGRSGEDAVSKRLIRGRMALGVGLSGVPLLVTWASVMWTVNWAGQLGQGIGEAGKYARQWTQFTSAAGAVFGSFGGAMLGYFAGRRIAYTGLCLGSLAMALVFFQTNTAFDAWFLISVFGLGFVTAAFYGWIPLYMPELFPTRLRATAQGFCYNFGRIIAAMGALQTGALLNSLGGSYPKACSLVSFIYVVGVAVIWLAPETKGKPLPE